MGPIIMRREVGAEALDIRAHVDTFTKASRNALMQTAQIVLIALAGVVTLLANPQIRHWLVEATANLLVLGGFIAAPILTVVAWIGLMLPAHLPLHRISSTLFIVALVWVAAGLLLAHMLHDSTASAK